MKKTMIEIKDMSFAYGRRKADVFADFSLTLSEGHVYGLLGKNGTGKSTLLYLMSGLLRPRKGSVACEGVEARLRRPEMLSEVMVVPEEFDLPKVTMSDFVRANEPFYPRFSREMLQACMDDFGLNAADKLGELSMGQRKKAYICFALAANTKWLFMDEPTNGLDIPSKTCFRQVVSRCMSEARSIVISTHQVRDVEMLLDHVVMIDGTHLLLDASLAAVGGALRFELRPAGADLSDALFTQGGVQGNLVMSAATGLEADETPVVLEVLFNALLENPAIATCIQ